MKYIPTFLPHGKTFLIEYVLVDRKQGAFWYPTVRGSVELFDYNAVDKSELIPYHLFMDGGMTVSRRHSE